MCHKYCRLASAGFVTKPILAGGVLILLSSLGANVALIRSNRELVARVEDYRTQLLVPKGVSLPPLKGIDLSGRSTVVGFENVNRPTVLFVFSPTCSSCSINWPNWDLLSGSQKKVAWRSVFVNVGGSLPANYIHAHSLDQQLLLTDISKETTLAYRLFYTPETIVLNSQGVAIYAWVGPLTANVTSAFPQTLSEVH
jgi:hypothetical protein